MSKTIFSAASLIASSIRAVRVYPEGEIPAEIEGRQPDGNLPDLTFWNVTRRYQAKIQSRQLNDDGTMTMTVVSEILESRPDLPPFTADPG
jgi:hypothetical protein